MFGSVTDEQLDLMTLEQVRMWTLARRQAAGSLVEDKPLSESAQRMREASHRWGLPRELMNHLVELERGSNRTLALDNRPDTVLH